MQMRCLQGTGITYLEHFKSIVVTSNSQLSLNLTAVMTSFVALKNSKDSHNVGPSILNSAYKFVTLYIVLYSCTF